ncbi:SREBP regulating gene protein [Anopheles ziemanni]|uniref:SREBP regulating gene protein n=1 Tax=Anopheles coustani TaxID=139045 RepID=UPI002659F9A7|nr:SREBP regulating gene protein [Anopheles coustani]XP_058176065.1 SREBP regulating gene protein [Anopheles ziemanni]
MCYVVVAKFLRRRLVLAIIFFFSLSYCMVHLISRNNNLSLNGDLQTQHLRHKVILWTKTKAELTKAVQAGGGTANETGEQQIPTNCRNSVQGKSLIVDDRGYVCPRVELLQNGCCDEADDEPSKQFACTTCKPNHCCAVYEYCVSCCLNSDKRSILEDVLAKANGRQVALYAEVTDQFELCLTKCRTNSQSVQNENKYRNPELKHCYGEMNEALWLATDGKDSQ